MIYARPPTEGEHIELQRMVRQAIGRVSQRAHLMLLSAQRRTVPELASFFDMSRATVRVWIRRFNVHGPAGWYDEPRSGRPRKLGPQVLATLLTMRQNDPRPVGYLAPLGTVALWGVALEHRLGTWVSASTVRGAWHGLGLRWGRPRLAMPLKMAPQKAHKQWVIAKAVGEAGPEAAILYGDDSRGQLLPLSRAMWYCVGQPRRIPTPGTHVTRARFGALNIRTGPWVYLVRERMRTADFLACLAYWLMAYPKGPILLVVDHFSRHTAHAVEAWRAVHPRLQLYYWPKYCSHLKPVERLWLRLKNTWAATRLYGSMKRLLETTEAFFMQMTPEQALKWAAA
jgi:transposase